MKTRLLFFSIIFAFMALPTLIYGQVTTSSLTGVVVNQAGETLPGATVVAVHEPSGTTYGTSTRSDGSYRINNMQVGGPYTIRYTFVGYRTYVVEEVFLRLGETYNQRATLSSEDVELDEVVVLGALDRTFNQERTGAGTSVSSDDISRVPTITRNIVDLTKLTPQSSGNSFAGRDNRFNNYTIDGSVYNNNFGLGDDQFAGGNPSA